GSVVRGAAVVGLAEPGLAEGGRLESSTGAAVVGLARKPVAVVGRGGAAVEQGPGTQAGGVTETEIVRGVGREIQAVVEHTPTAHLRHVGEGVGIAAATANVAAQEIVGRFQGTAAEDVGV